MDCKKFENVKISHQDGRVCKTEKFSIGACRNKWVLNLDGDEVLSIELKDEIIDFITSRS